MYGRKREKKPRGIPVLKHMSIVLAGALLTCSVAAEDWRSKIDAMYAQYDSEESAGAIVAVVVDGEAEYLRGFGMENIEKGVPITRDTRFNVASVSKQFTAACIALLVLEGKVDLDEEIQYYLPYLPDYGHKVTVQHLIHHTSGITDVFGLIEQNKIRFRYPYGNEDVLPIIAGRKELEFTPGEKFSYSNSNYILLAEIVQKVTGYRLNEFATERIFKPLGMDNTRFDDNLHLWEGQRAESYHRTPKGKYRHLERVDYLIGDGNIVTTIDDMMKWDANYRTGKVGGKAFLDLMQSQGKLNNGATIEYAFGIFVTENHGRPCIQHSGAWLGFRAYWEHFHEDHVSVIILGNHNYLKNFDEVSGFYFGAE